MIDKNSTKEQVLEAVKQAGYALQYASEELRGDHEVVMEAVKENGYVLKYASMQLKEDRDFIVKAARSLSDKALYHMIWFATMNCS